MSSQLRAILHLWLLWVPYAKSAVCRSGSYQVASGIPCYCLDAVKAISSLRVRSEMRVTYVWEPGPREAGSWYDWTLRVGKRTANLSLAIGLRGCGGAIATTVKWAKTFLSQSRHLLGLGNPKSL